MKAFVIVLASLLVAQFLMAGAGAPSSPALILPSLADVAGAITTAVSRLAGFVLSLFIGNAAAACGSGASQCYWIGGTGSTTQTAHWSASSGGATCGCTPAASDDVNFDAASGAGTVTIVGGFAIRAVNMTASSVAVTATSGTWSLYGNWWDPAAAWNPTGGTVDLYSAAGPAISINEPNNFYNVRFLPLGATGHFLIGGYGTVQSNFAFTISSTVAVGNGAIAYGTSLTIGSQTTTWINATVYPWGTGLTLPAYGMYAAGVCMAGGKSATMGGAVTITGHGSCGGQQGALYISNGATFSTGNYALKIPSDTYGIILAGTGILHAGTSTVEAKQVKVLAAGGYITSSYAYLGPYGFQWYVNGTWSDVSTASDSLWDFQATLAMNLTYNATYHFSFGTHIEWKNGATIWGNCQPSWFVSHPFCVSPSLNGELQARYGPWWGTKLYFDTNLILWGALTLSMSPFNEGQQAGAHNVLIVFLQAHTITAWHAAVTNPTSHHGGA